MVAFCSNVYLIKWPLSIFSKFLVWRALNLVDEYTGRGIRKFSRPFIEAFNYLISNASTYSVGFRR